MQFQARMTDNWTQPTTACFFTRPKARCPDTLGRPVHSRHRLLDILFNKKTLQKKGEPKMSVRCPRDRMRHSTEYMPQDRKYIMRHGHHPSGSLALTLRKRPQHQTQHKKPQPVKTDKIVIRLVHDVLFVHMLSPWFVRYTVKHSCAESVVRAVHHQTYTFRVRGSCCMSLDIQLHYQ